MKFGELREAVRRDVTAVGAPPDILSIHVEGDEYFSVFRKGQWHEQSFRVKFLLRNGTIEVSGETAQLSDSNFEFNATVGLSQFGDCVFRWTAPSSIPGSSGGKRSRRCSSKWASTECNEFEAQGRRLSGGFHRQVRPHPSVSAGLAVRLGRYATPFHQGEAGAVDSSNAARCRRPAGAATRRARRSAVGSSSTNESWSRIHASGMGQFSRR